jgi:uncharacterized FlgJ-related protein
MLKNVYCPDIAGGAAVEASRGASKLAQQLRDLFPSE